MKKLQEIIEYIDHINACDSRVCDKAWLQEELHQLEGGVKTLRDVASEQLNQYVNYIQTLENALNAIKREAKETDAQIIIDIVESALEYGK